jgi:hypothetical protein
MTGAFGAAPDGQEQERQTREDAKKAFDAADQS